MVHSDAFKLISLIQNASLPVFLVMSLLFALSISIWWVIFIKIAILRRASRETGKFESEFWMGGDLNKRYESIIASPLKLQGLTSIFEAGFREFLRFKRQGNLEVSDVTAGVRRAMRANYTREMDRLENHLPYLATVGSISPYIGLLGTVWGIMNAFLGLSNNTQATLAQVAPGIAEALLATAFGLFAAIPAVVAYNHFLANIEKLSTRYESFIEDFTNILQR